MRYTDAQPMRSQCVAHYFQIKRSRSHVIWRFCCVPSLVSSFFDRITSYVAYMYTTHEGAMCHASFSGSKVKVPQVVSSFGFVCSVASSLFDWITSYVAYIQHMRGRCVTHHFHDQRSRSHGSFQFFGVSSPWLPHLTESLHMWHTYSIWGSDVWHTNFRTKGQGHKGRFQFWPLYDWMYMYVGIWRLSHTAAIRSLDLLVILVPAGNSVRLSLPPFLGVYAPQASGADSRFAPSQWEMALLCNDISHWLGASLESALASIQRMVNSLHNTRSRLTYVGGKIFWLPGHVGDLGSRSRCQPINNLFTLSLPKVENCLSNHLKKLVAIAL